MTIILILLLVLGGLPFVTRPAVEATFEIPSWLDFSNSGLDSQAISEIVRAANVWTEAYGPCPQNVTVRMMEVELKEPGYVSLDSTIPGDMMIFPRHTYDVALHAFSHACAGQIQYVQPVPFSEGLITGFRGLGIQVLINTGETYFMKIEEGVAERNSMCADGNYVPETIPYQRLADLSLELFPCGDDSVVGFLKTSDVAGMAAYLFNKPRNEVVMGDITDLMDLYLSAWLDP